MKCNALTILLTLMTCFAVAADSLDDYLAFCEEVGKSPEKEYKGTFNVRISPERHKEMVLIVFEKGIHYV